MRVFSTVLPFALLATPARADVVESAPNSFLVKTVVSIAAPAAKVYDAIASHLGRWWHPDHTFSGNANNCTIDARPGGCWCERLRDGGVQHATVVYADPGKKLRFSGALGPLQEFALTGTLTPFVDKMLAEQLGRLKSFVEKAIR